MKKFGARNMLAIQVPGSEEGGGDECGGRGSRTLQGGGQNWGELSVLTLPHMKVALLVGILMMTTQRLIFLKSVVFRSCSCFACTSKADRDVSVLEKIHSD